MTTSTDDSGIPPERFLVCDGLGAYLTPPILREHHTPDEVASFSTFVRTRQVLVDPEGEFAFPKYVYDRWLKERAS
jgi:hypothetical protein